MAFQSGSACVPSTNTLKLTSWEKKDLLWELGSDSQVLETEDKAGSFSSFMRGTALGGVFLVFILFTYLAVLVLVAAHGVSSLCCSMQILSCGMWKVVPWPGIELGPQQWKHRALTIGPPGSSHPWHFFCNPWSFLVSLDFLLDTVKADELLRRSIVGTWLCGFLSFRSWAQEYYRLILIWNQGRDYNLPMCSF